LAAAERAIAQIPGRLASRPDELKDEAFREKIQKLSTGCGGLYLVAEESGKIVGHAFVEALDLAVTSHVVRLTIAVHEGSQRRGFGRMLMNELIGWSTANPKIEKIELQVRSSNHGAIALYASLGFVEEGRKTKRLKLGPIRGALARSEPRHDDRRGRVGCRAVAELGPRVVPPAKEIAAAAQRAAVLGSAPDRRRAVERDDAHRRRRIDHRAVSELAVLVEAPAPDGSAC
jgi:putative acetyltransferase